MGATGLSTVSFVGAMTNAEFIIGSVMVTPSDRPTR